MSFFKKHRLLTSLVAVMTVSGVGMSLFMKQVRAEDAFGFGPPFLQGPENSKANFGELVSWWEQFHVPRVVESPLVRTARLKMGAQMVYFYYPLCSQSQKERVAAESADAFSSMDSSYDREYAELALLKLSAKGHDISPIKVSNLNPGLMAKSSSYFGGVTPPID